MNVSIIGTGYVGLVTGVAIAAAGHRVMCVGRKQQKVALINAGSAPFFEPGLNDLLRRVFARKRFVATTNLDASVASTEITILAVGTPTVDGAIDLSEVKKATMLVGKALARKFSYHVVAVKSTVVPGTTESVVKPILEQSSGKSTRLVGLCMNPEFLREGNALEDALHPDRIVIGSTDNKSARVYAKLFSNSSCPVFFTNLPTAEMSKYVSNVLLSTLVSFSNEIGNLAAQTPGVDVAHVWKIVHADNRWSPSVGKKKIMPGIIHYLFTGCGYGGSCFPKDTKALYHFAIQKGVDMPMLGSTMLINGEQPHRIVDLLEEELRELRGRRIVVLGLTFKPNTDDTRESPGIAIAHELVARGANVVCHDPQAYHRDVPEPLVRLGAILEERWESALKGAEGVIVATAWDVYKNIAPEEFLRLMKQPVVIDGRRLYDPKKFTEAGIDYRAVGRAR